MCSIRKVLAFYCHFQVISSQMTSLPGHFWSFPCHITPSYCKLSVVGSEMCSIREFPAFYSHFQATSDQITSSPVPSGYLRSCDVISCRVTPFHCSYSLVGSEMYSIWDSRPSTANCRLLPVKWPLLGHFWSPEIMWRHLCPRDSFQLRATAL